ncbi:hypothetical protein [Maridesulfovibrio sp.]|uniref:hypothetical protein n=1 Tax=Maridesulfovibrio sp. TaxID=2795000 RepID=UPI0029C9DEA4|nr:hypothetical protein [Maridesulfovibrio sp.]
MISRVDMRPETATYNSTVQPLIDTEFEFLIYDSSNKKHTLIYRSKTLSRLEGRDGRIIFSVDYTEREETVAVYLFIKELFAKVSQITPLTKTTLNEFTSSTAIEKEIDRFNILLKINSEWQSPFYELSQDSILNQYIHFHVNKYMQQNILCVESVSTSELIASAAEHSKGNPVIIPLNIDSNRTIKHALDYGYDVIVPSRQFERVLNSKESLIETRASGCHRLALLSRLIDIIHRKINLQEPDICIEQGSICTRQYTFNGVVNYISAEAVEVCRELRLTPERLDEIITETNPKCSGDSKDDDWNMILYYASLYSILNNNFILKFIDYSPTVIPAEPTETLDIPQERTPLYKQYSHTLKIMQEWSLRTQYTGQVGGHNAQ